MPTAIMSESIQTYDAFKLHWYVWQMCGLKLPSNTKWKYPYLVYGIFINLTVTVTFPATLIVKCFLSATFMELCENTYMTITDILCNLKFLNVVAVRSKLLGVKRILDKLDSRSKTDDEVECLKRGIKSAYKCFYTIAAIYTYATLTGQLSVFMASERRLMYPAWFPLDWENSPRDFAIVHLYQLYGLIVQASQNVANDTYPQAYLRIMCAHIDALSLRILRLGNNGLSHEENYRKLVECIKDHKIIIELSRHLSSWSELMRTFVSVIRHIYELHETIQDIISISCLAQFVCSGLAQCTMSVYMLYMGMDISKLLNITIFFVSVTFEVLILCHFGDQLCQKSEDLTNAIYSCNWMDQSEKFKLAYLLLLRRSQKEFQIFAGGIIPVRLPTFVQFMKTAYSMFAVMREVN